VKVFIRTIDPTISLLTGDRLPGGRLLSCGRDWIKFQDLMKGCLRELGHTVAEQPSHPRVEDEDEGAGFRIYAHKTRRDVAGDLYYKQMHLCDLFTLDSEGWGADHSATNQPDAFDGVDPEAATRFCLAMREQFLASGLSKHPQPPRAPAGDLSEGYIFVPLQRPRDYVQIHHSPISVVEFLAAIVDWAESGSHPVAVKPHPSNVDDPDVMQELDRWCRGARSVRRIDGNVHDLVSRSSAVFTINSGVGFESLFHGKPVVTFGASDYARVTYRATADRLDDARQYATEYTEAQRQRAWQFLYHYCFEHGYYLGGTPPAECRRRLLAYLASRPGIGAGDSAGQQRAPQGPIGSRGSAEDTATAISADS
jgi:hypothetical protein